MTNSFKARSSLAVGNRSYEIWSLAALPREKVARLPYSLKVLLENLLRFEDGVNVTRNDIEALLAWDPAATPSHEIAFTPSRVILQDFTGVPCVVDLAAMRDAIVRLGGDAERVNPLAPAELVIDHSVQVDEYGSPGALAANTRIEFARNGERYAFLRWGQSAFRNFAVVPPSTGIVHQVNLEYLGRVDLRRREGRRAQRLSRHAGRHRLAHHHDQRPRRARLGRGRHRGGGGHARPAGHHADSAGHRLAAHREAAARGHRHRPGAHRHGDAAQEGRGRQVRRVLRRRPRRRCRSPTAPPSPTWRRSTAAPAASSRSTRRRSATCSSPAARGSGSTSSPPTRKHQGLWRTQGEKPAQYTDVLELDLGTVEPSLAGPRRPQDRVPLKSAKSTYESNAQQGGRGARRRATPPRSRRPGHGASDARRLELRAARTARC